MRVLFALDIGTSKLSAVALSLETLKPVVVCSRANDADVAGLGPDRHEQYPNRLRELSLELLGQLSHDPALSHAKAKVEGIGITGQMHGVLLVDRQLKPVTNLITWRDGRVTETENDVGNVANTRAQYTGCGLHAGYGGLTLQWLARNGQLDQQCVALSIADYIAACLTGVVATDPTHAASWGIFDIQQQRWDSVLLEQLGIREDMLPTVQPTDTIRGALLEGCREQIGLPDRVPVCGTVGDNQAGIVGVCGFAGDIVVLNLGSGGQVSIIQKEFALTEPLETRPMPLGGVVLVGASLYGGLAYAYLAEFFQAVTREMTGSEPRIEDVYARINTLATESPNGAAGLAVDTRFAGVRGEPDIRGAISGIGRDNLTPPHLARAFVEGMVTELWNLVPNDLITATTRVIAAGNAVRKNPIVPEVIRSVAGIEPLVATTREEAAVGAACVAAVALGLLNPDDVVPQLQSS